MFNNKKIEELEDDIKHLHKVCITLTKMVDNLQGCLKDQLDINRLVRERLIMVSFTRAINSLR